eukprot:7656265-Lingulodinium_polyedra.AAC.1
MSCATCRRPQRQDKHIGEAMKIFRHGFAAQRAPRLIAGVQPSGKRRRGPGGGRRTAGAGGG